MSEQPMLALLNLVLLAAAVYALGSYWLLAARTIKGRPFKSGLAFWVACGAALFSTAAVVETLPTTAALLVAGPIIAASAFCLYRQGFIARQDAQIDQQNITPSLRSPTRWSFNADS